MKPYLSLLLVFLPWMVGCKRSLPEQSGVQWAPFLEWSLANESYEGNPFDLQASASFVHEESGETRRTPLFFAGDGQWKFRFSGTRPGRWTFSTQSIDEDLDGFSGSAVIHPNDTGYGFVGGEGSKWVRQKGRDGEADAFIPQYVMYHNPLGLRENASRLDEDIRIFLQEHGFTGFHVPVYCRWFDIEHDRSGEIAPDDPNPDLETFEVLETFIAKVHAAGGVVHFWAWGDEARKQTPAKWGINGEVDRRLQRYLAARLGPLPGWTMGYGFDLDEWVTKDQVAVWRDHMHEHLGWPHMLGGRPADPNRGTNHAPAVSWNENLDYASYEHHQPDTEVYAAALRAVPGKPVFSEDRFRIRQSDRYRDKDYTEEMTRRGLWHSTLAGGVANIWGKLDGDLSINMGFGASLPYEHPDWIQTWSIFFEDRFTLDCEPVHHLTDGLALRGKNRDQAIFYKEEAESIRLDLSGFSQPAAAFAVDTLKPYQEIFLGILTPDTQTWTAPHASDWAIAVGEFPQPYPDSAVVEDIVFDWSTHRRSAQGSDNFQLTWSDDGHLYGAWGDGGGFGGTNSEGRVGLGFARIEGDAGNYEGYNVWGGFEPENPATFDGKSWAAISIQGSLYMWVVPDKPAGKTYRNHYEYIELAKSNDKGATWTKAPWRFIEAEEITIPTFLNFGKDNAGVPGLFGDYVYSYFIAPQSITMEQQGPRGVELVVHKPGKLYLARVRPGELMSGKEAYAFFCGLDVEGRPRWGSLAEKQPVFEDRNGAGWCMAASYNPFLDRVILTIQHSWNPSSILGFFDAPTPWGPWTTMKYYSPGAPFGHERPGSDLPWAPNVFFAAFPTKWLDGENFTLNFTGGGFGKNNDSFNTVDGKFILR